jgi:hypothetical protein
MSKSFILASILMVLAKVPPVACADQSKSPDSATFRAADNLSYSNH